MADYSQGISGLSRESLVDLIETAQDLIWQCDANGRYIYLNPAWEEVLGYPLAEMLGRHFADFQSAACAEHDQQEFARLLQGDVIKGYETVHLARDGREIHLVFNAKAVRDQQGNLIGTRGTAHDITERKEAEESLFKANRAYQALSACNELIAKATDETELLTTATGIVRHDCGFLLAWIGIAEHDTAKTVRPVAQSGFEDGYLSSISISWGDNAMGHGPTGTAIRTRQPCVFQDTLNDPAYEPWREKAIERGYRSSASFPIRLGEEVYGVLNVYADAPRAFADKEVELLARLAENLAFGIASIRGKNARERAEQAIQQLNRELDKRVVERTAQMKAAIREQESFSYSVSHDLRAPLRHINSFSTMLMQDFAAALPPQARDYLDRIAAASSRMGELIDDLLQLSRVSRAEMARVNIDLTEMARSIANSLQESDPSRTVQFAIAQGLTVQGDPTLLRLTMENLLGNAWKYSCKKSAARIELGVKVIDGREVFFVRDNGAGFDMTYKNKLFGAFQRLHGADFEGTGVGLATVQRIVHRHGGRVWAEGSVDQGATFYFTLQAPDRGPSSCDQLPEGLR